MESDEHKTNREENRRLPEIIDRGVRAIVLEKVPLSKLRTFDQDEVTIPHVNAILAEALFHKEVEMVNSEWKIKDQLSKQLEDLPDYTYEPFIDEVLTMLGKLKYTICIAKCESGIYKARFYNHLSMKSAESSGRNENEAICRGAMIIALLERPVIVEIYSRKKLFNFKSTIA